MGRSPRGGHCRRRSNWNYGSGPTRTLWRNEILELTNNVAQSGRPRLTGRRRDRIRRGGNDRTTPRPIVRLQLAARGIGNDATMQLAQQLFELMALDGVGRELRQQQIPGFAAADNSTTDPWMIVSVVVLNRPAQVGRDERNRVKIVSNLESRLLPDGAIVMSQINTGILATAGPRTRKMYQVLFNAVDVGLTDVVDPTGVKLTGRKITAGTFGKDLALGYRVTGSEGTIKVQILQLNLAQYIALCPWYSGTGAIPLTPPNGADLYTYAKTLVLHPIQNASSTTEDLNYGMCCPMTSPGQVKRDGGDDDVWEIEFMPFPNRTTLSTTPTAMTPGNVGP